MGETRNIMPNLTLKEHKAIEYRYLGVPHAKIAKEIDVPKSTVDEWFKGKRGRLSPYYKEFAEGLNKKRQEKIEEQMYISDKEITRACRAVLQKYNELLLYGHKKVLMQNGELVLDESGNPRYYYEPYTPSFSDVVKAWKLQQVMRGLPTSIKQCPRCKRVS